MGRIVKPCAEPGCSALVESGRFCVLHARASRRAFDQRRGSSAARGYDSKWRRARAAFLLEHPLCAMCERQGFVTMATVVDHKVPFRRADGSIDEKLRWSRSNWQSLCKTHHDGDKQADDATNRRRRPVDGVGGV